MFHTYEEPQFPELKDHVMMSAQVPSYCGKQKDRCGWRNKMKGSADAVGWSAWCVGFHS